jgi:hypothetical protein
MADFDIIEDVSKAIPKGKDLKKFTPFIVAGLGLGVITLMMNRNKGSALQVSDQSGVGQSSDLGGLMADFTNQTNEAIKKSNDGIMEGVNSQLNTVISNLYDVITGQKEYIDQVKTSQQTVIDQIRADVTGTTNAIDRIGADVKTQLADVKSSYNTVFNTQETVSSVLPSVTSIYFDGKNDADQFKTIVAQVNQAVSSGTITQATATQTVKQVAGLGNDGVGWTAESWKPTQQRLETDPTFKQSEIDRARLVIENRQAQGLSITNQVNYLNSLMK